MVTLFRTRYILYVILVVALGWFVAVNFFLTKQDTVMYKFLIDEPTSYNVKYADNMASNIYNSFRQEVKGGSIEEIREFVTTYNDKIPFLSVNYIYLDDSGVMKSVLDDIKEVDILSAKYVYPIRHGDREIGTLLVYDINKVYAEGIREYKHIQSIIRFSSGGVILLILSGLIYWLYSTKVEHDKFIAEYKSVHDGLTGLYTHKYFKERLEKEIARAQRYKRPLSLIMCDIDHFKNFNDTYGHLVGDMMLKTVAQIMGENVRSSDLVARYGGEEFAVLLLETGAQQAQSAAERLKRLTEQAVDIAERIKEKVEHTEIKLDHKHIHATISMGLSSYNGHEDYKGEYLIGEADHALYESKEHGRNQITIYDPETKTFARDTSV